MIMLDNQKDIQNHRITLSLIEFEILPSAFMEDETLIGLLNTIDMYATMVEGRNLTLRTSGDYFRLGFSLKYDVNTPDYSENYYTREAWNQEILSFDIFYRKGRERDFLAQGEFQSSSMENFAHPRLGIAITHAVSPFQIGAQTIYSFGLNREGKLVTAKTEKSAISLELESLPQTGKTLVR